MYTNPGGDIAQQCWEEIPQHYRKVILHGYVVMPNHVHGILQILELTGDGNVGAQNLEPLHFHPIEDSRFSEDQLKATHMATQNNINRFQHIIPGSLGCIVRGYEIGVTKWFRKCTNVYDVWQRNFYDHIIRTEEEYKSISRYIRDNPNNWTKDPFRK
jgi:REP element-mobilizing transposase RayT